jgi:hypothetical protein
MEPNDIMSIAAGLSPNDKAFLGLLAAAVPPGGTIVEVGTGYGGSSTLLRLVADKGCAIHTLDVREWPGVAERLAPLNIHRHLGGAEAFRQGFDGPIDLLFIDGDHSFAGVRRDFDTLAPLVKPGGTIAFHDHSMLGIRLLCDALEAAGALRGFCGVHNFVAATKVKDARQPGADEYTAALDRHLHKARFTAPKCGAQDFWPFGTYWGNFDDLKDAQLVGRGCMGWFVKTLYGLPGDLFINSDQARRPQANHILLSAAFQDIAYALQVKAFVSQDRIAVYPQFRMAEAFMEQVLSQDEGAMRLAADDLEREVARRTFGALSRTGFQALAESTFVAKFIREFWYFRWFSDFAAAPVPPKGA